jgi:hypothetical protein
MERRTRSSLERSACAADARDGSFAESGRPTGRRVWARIAAVTPLVYCPRGRGVTRVGRRRGDASAGFHPKYGGRGSPT